MTNTTLPLLSFSVVGGMLGGIVNFAQLTKEERGPKWWLDAGRSIATGIGAGLVVPLFLFTIRSEIPEKAKTDTDYYLAVLGFAVLSGIFAKAFLDIMGKKALRLAEAANDKADRADKRSKDLEVSVTEPGEPLEISTESTLILSEEESRIMDLFPSALYRLRSLHGLGRAAELHPQEMRLLLDSLVSKSLLTEIDTAEGKRFMLTQQGATHLGKKAENLGLGNEPGHKSKKADENPIN